MGKMKMRLSTNTAHSKKLPISVKYRDRVCNIYEQQSLVA